MDRLGYVILFTPQLDRLRRFYRDQLGLGVRRDGPRWVEFDSAGATLALHDMPDLAHTGIQLRLLVSDVATRVRELAARGVHFEAGVQRVEGGTLATFWDPEDVHVSVMTPERAPAAGQGLRLSTAMINCRDLHAAKAFYRNVLGLHVAKDSAWWVEFDTGEAHLALHPRIASPSTEHHHARPISFGFSIPGLIEWADRRRARGLTFVTTPHDTPFGVMADVADPDGNMVVLHEPGEADGGDPADGFDDEALPARGAIRRPIALRAHAASRLAVRPAYRTSAPATPRRRSASPARARAGAGSAGAAATLRRPKRTASATRVKATPATGRMKKAERRSFTEQRRATAASSRRKPVARAAAPTSGAARTSAAARKGTAARPRTTRTTRTTRARPRGPR